MIRLGNIREKTMSGEKHFFSCDCGFKGTFNDTVKHLVSVHNINKAVAQGELYYTYFSRNGKVDKR